MEPFGLWTTPSEDLVREKRNALTKAFDELASRTKYDRPEPGTRIRVHPDTAKRMGLGASERVVIDVVIDDEQPTWLISREDAP